jgi:hypothetical protein
MQVYIDIPDPLNHHRKKLVSQIADATETVVERLAPLPESHERELVRNAVTHATNAVLQVLDGGQELLSPSYAPGYVVLPLTMVKCDGERPNLAGGLSDIYMDMFEFINDGEEE